MRAAISSSVPTEGWEIELGVGRFFNAAIEVITACTSVGIGSNLIKRHNHVRCGMCAWSIFYRFPPPGEVRVQMQEWGLRAGFPRTTRQNGHKDS